jgi:hypothetical protein
MPGEARMRALYVNLGDFGLWDRPVETTPSDACLLVLAASIEYDVWRSKFVAPTDPAVIQAVRELGAPPQVPDAPRVNWPD